MAYLQTNKSLKVQDIKNLQQSDENLKQLSDKVLKSPDKKIKVRQGEFILHNGLLFNIQREIHKLCLPDFLCLLLLNKMHFTQDLHFSPYQMNKVYNRNYWSPNSMKMCRESNQNCIVCKLNFAKYTPRFLGERRSTYDITRPNEVWFIDLLELPRSRTGYKYVMLMIDCVSQYVMGRAMKSQSQEETIRKLRGVFCVMTPPRFIYCDLASNFGSSFISFLAQNNIQCLGSISRRPQSQSLVELAVKTTKNYLLKLVHSNLNTTDRLDWPLLLHTAIRSINIQSHPHSSQTSREFLLFSPYATSAVPILTQDPSNYQKKCLGQIESRRQKQHMSKENKWKRTKHFENNFYENQFVFLRTIKKKTEDGSQSLLPNQLNHIYQILERVDDQRVIVRDISDPEQDNFQVSVERLKPIHLRDLVNSNFDLFPYHNISLTRTGKVRRNKIIELKLLAPGNINADDEEELVRPNEPGQDTDISDTSEDEETQEILEQEEEEENEDHNKIKVEAQPSLKRVTRSSLRTQKDKQTKNKLKVTVPEGTGTIRDLTSNSIETTDLMERVKKMTQDELAAYKRALTEHQMNVNHIRKNPKVKGDVERMTDLPPTELKEVLSYRYNSYSRLTTDLALLPKMAIKPSNKKKKRVTFNSKIFVASYTIEAAPFYTTVKSLMENGEFVHFLTINRIASKHCVSFEEMRLYRM